jgi:hypothetical protein
MQNILLKITICPFIRLTSYPFFLLAFWLFSIKYIFPSSTRETPFHTNPLSYPSKRRDRAIFQDDHNV